MLEKKMVFDKIMFILEPTEEIEYASLEKKRDFNVLVLTNQRIIFTNCELLNKDVFHFFKIKNNNVQTINRIKKNLQSETNINDIIKQYFN
ncbi:MAG: hypothetical protein K2P85_02305 [Flavobacteriaceae bacterium]|nr:hypothetical protein [Flavobacteriaceae bacterium]